MTENRIIAGVSDTQAHRVAAQAKRDLEAIAIANGSQTAEFERKCRENNALSPELAQGLIDIFQNKRPASDCNLADVIEAAERKAESIVSRWYQSKDGSKFRGFLYLYGADDFIRSITTKAIKKFTGYGAGPDQVVVIATSQPGEYWKIATFDDLLMAMQVVSLDIHCDLDLMTNTDVGPCLDSYAWLRDLKRLDKDGCTDRDGLPNPHQREFIPKHICTVPFVIGNVIILTRMCMMCYGAWLCTNQIDTKRLGEIEPVSDGFGSVGAGPIESKEYFYE